MKSVTIEEIAQQEQRKNSFFYRTAWRWHFYAGLFVIPFLLMLSVTGMMMLYDEQIQSVRYGGVSYVEVQGNQLKAAEQLEIIQSKYPEGLVKKYLPGKTESSVSFFVVKTADYTLHVALNPYTGVIQGEIDRDDSWYALANEVHGSLLFGEWGDRLIEVATGLIVLLVVSGVYLWFGGSTSTGLVFFPSLGKGKRIFFKQLHSTLGLYSLIFLIFFVLSGLSWSGVWGAKIVQAWNSFPAEKWSNVPLSDLDHSSLNQGVMEEVPWNLEQTPLPISRAVEAEKQTISLNRVVNIAQQLSMSNFQVNLPASEDGVYTISADTMSGDIADPRLDRTVHIDQYSAEVLTDVGWQQYTVMAKFMAAGIGLHQGGLGWVNLLVNTIICLVFIIISVSGLFLWWLRKPSNQWSIGAPKSMPSSQRWYMGLIGIVVIGVLFPLSGITIVCIVLLDSIIYLVKDMFRPKKPLQKRV